MKPPAAVAVPTPAQPPPTLSEAERAWGLAKDTTSIGVLEAFIARYKDTLFADLVRARIDELRKQQLAVSAPPKAPQPACWHATYQGAPPDGSAWLTSCSDETRVVRGGSWRTAPSYLRSADRHQYAPDVRTSGVGFRVARTLD
jgi:hypothetical protein